MGKQQAPKAAVPAKEQPQKATKGHIVLNSFRDIDNFDKAYNPGDDVSHFDKERLKKLVENGLVQAPKGGAKATETPNPADTPPAGDEGNEGDEGGEGGDNGEE